MKSSFLWQKAAAFAAGAHRNQIRRDGSTPYFAHVVRVSFTVACVFGITDETILAAALLHDVIEDTEIDYDELHEQFGMEVADIVACLSKDMRLIESKREAAYDKQLKEGPWQARPIKLADVYDNFLDAKPGPARTKVLGKVERALNLSRNDPKLEEPRRIVTKLVESIQNSEK